MYGIQVLECFSIITALTSIIFTAVQSVSKIGHEVSPELTVNTVLPLEIIDTTEGNATIPVLQMGNKGT